MDHSTHTPLAEIELNSANLMDSVVYGAEDAKIGTVSNVHGMGSDTQVIVDVGGLFGIGTKPVALLRSQLNFMRNENGEVHATTTMSKEQVKALPEYQM